LALTESEGTFSAEEKISVRTSRHKLIYNIQTGRERLFDLQDDPYENNDLSDSRPILRNKLRVPIHALFTEKFAGLHIACRSNRGGVVHGSVDFARPVATRIHLYFHEDSDAAELVEAEFVKFSFNLEDGFDALLVQGPTVADGARFELEFNGSIMPPEVIDLGRRHVSPPDNPWKAESIGAYAVEDFAAAARLAGPRGISDPVRCFVSATRISAAARVPAPEAPIEDEFDDSELQEILRALGYVE
jgi:hypothetical protein